MKILLTRNLTGAMNQQQDYLSDSIFHGLKKLGNEVVDAPRLWYMYSSEFQNNNSIQKLYGKGFTLYGLLNEQEDTVDRSDIVRKIINKYFDLIIIARFDLSTPYLEVILENYPANRIVVLDGWDGVNYPHLVTAPEIVAQCHFSNFDLIRSIEYKTIYFKRELSEPRKNVYSIPFSFPKEKIRPRTVKSKPFSHIDPRDTATYIHYDENSYYNDYGGSLFGVTMKKVGWDCLRHYEILGIRCVPHFIDIDECPPDICISLPKKELKEINLLIKQYGAEIFLDRYLDLYDSYEHRIHQHFINNCTTEAVAKYMLDTVESLQ